MAAFVYFLIGMPTSWIMSATAAAPGHSLHKQQLEMQNLGHCLGDFLQGLTETGLGEGAVREDGKAAPKLGQPPHLSSTNDSQDGLSEHRCRNGLGSHGGILLPRT